MKVLRLVTVATCCVALLALNVACKKDQGAAGEAAVSAVKVPDKPDEVFTQAVASIKANKPVEVYALLPDSYRKDIQGIVTLATSKMDRELFELAVKVVDKAVAALGKHGDKVAEAFGQGIPIDVKAAIKTVTEVHALLKEVGLLDFAAFQKLDVSGFLAQHGTKLMTKGMDIFKTFGKDEFEMYMKGIDSVKVALKETKDDTATVEVTLMDDTKPITLKKVEGRWVPAEMADDWSGAVAEAKKNIEEAATQALANKEQAKKMLEGILEGLTKFEADGDMTALQSLVMGMAAM